MNERIKKLMLEAGYAAPELAGRANILAELLIKDVLDEVNERVYVIGDRQYSNDHDRQWVELTYGKGPLAK